MLSARNEDSPRLRRFLEDLADIAVWIGYGTWSPTATEQLGVGYGLLGKWAKDTDS
jgi:hypothetical protein